MAKKPKVPKIKPLENYDAMSDTDVVVRGTAVLTGLNGNVNFTTLPVDLAALKTDIDSFSALMAEAQDGSKKVIAQKDKQRLVVVKKLRMLGRYVDVESNGDMSIFTSSGFQAAATTKATPSPLRLPVILNVDHGAISGEIVIQIQALAKALSFVIRYGAQVNGADPTAWTEKTVTRVRPPAGIQGLTPGTVYAFQVRALGKLGYTDWTDSTTCMCV